MLFLAQVKKKINKVFESQREQEDDFNRGTDPLFSSLN